MLSLLPADLKQFWGIQQSSHTHLRPTTVLPLRVTSGKPTPQDNSPPTKRKGTCPAFILPEACPQETSFPPAPTAACPRLSQLLPVRLIAHGRPKTTGTGEPAGPGRHLPAPGRTQVQIQIEIKGLGTGASAAQPHAIWEGGEDFCFYSVFPSKPLPVWEVKGFSSTSPQICSGVPFLHQVSAFLISTCSTLPLKSQWLHLWCAIRYNIFYLKQNKMERAHGCVSGALW